MITVIDNYDSFTFNLVQFLGDLGQSCQVIRNDAMVVDAMLAQRHDAIILSPGPCTPNEAGICLDLVQAAPKGLPILGVCLGHQTIGQAFGATIIRANEIMHGKRSAITHTQTGLFEGLPQPLTVTRYHSLVIEPSSLPDTLEVTAQTDEGVIMAVAHRDRPIMGVQFHPESIASQAGHYVLMNFLKMAGLPFKSPPLGLGLPFDGKIE